MVEETRFYPGIPAGAVYAASLATLEGLGLKIGTDSRINQLISAYPKDSPWFATKQVVLEMNEIDQATRVTLRGGLLGPEPDGKGPRFLQALLEGVEAEIEKIKAAGRIVAVEAPKYSFGQVTSVVAAQPAAVAPPVTTASSPGPSPMAPAAAVPGPYTPPESAPKESSFGKWLMNVGFFIGGVIFLNSETGQKIISDVTAKFGMPADVVSYTWEDIGEQVKGMELQNAFGAKFEVIRVRDFAQVSKTDEKVVCTANVSLGNGTTERMRISVEEGDSAMEVFYSVEPL